MADLFDIPYLGHTFTSFVRRWFNWKPSYLISCRESPSLLYVQSNLIYPTPGLPDTVSLWGTWCGQMNEASLHMYILYVCTALHVLEAIFCSVHIHNTHSMNTGQLNQATTSPLHLEMIRTFTGLPARTRKIFIANYMLRILGKFPTSPCPCVVRLEKGILVKSIRQPGLQEAVKLKLPLKCWRKVPMNPRR